MSKKIFAAALFLFIFSFNLSLAFWPNPTHQELTKEIVKFYNQSSEIKISQEQADWIIAGSVKEDTPPRWINHFYDPVLNQGWSGEKQGNVSQETVNLLSKIFLSIKDATSSINWAFDQKLQERYLLYQGDQTYSKAVQAYVFSGLEKGSVAVKPDFATFENAFKALGHVLHLIEDLGVPAHTRNDTHAGINESINDVDPYEKWFSQSQNINFSNLNNSNIKGNIFCSDTKDCFIKLAKYSNKNFYSKNTIDDPKYSKLESESSKNIGDKYIYFRHDNFGNFYSFKVSDKDDNFSVVDSIIHQSYWNLLSKQVVIVGAQVIKNFFKDAQDNAQVIDYQPQMTKIDIPTVPIVSLYGETEKAKGTIGSFWDSAIGAVKNTLSSVGEFFSGLFVGENNYNLAEQISLDDSNIQSNLTINNKLANSNSSSKSGSTNDITALKKEISSLKNEINTLKNGTSKTNTVSNKSNSNKTSNSNSSTTADSQNDSQDDSSSNKTVVNLLNNNGAICYFDNSQNPARNKVLINEAAWMGSTNSASDEWIELKNISTQNVDLSNWQLVNKNGKIYINFSDLKNKNLSPGKFLLLERTDDNSVSNITADLIYAGALSNSDEGLKLFDGQCNLMDEVSAGSSWPAGDNYLKKTMEKNNGDFGWHTSAYVGGTPKAENLVVYSGGGGGAVVVNNTNQNSNNSTQNNLNSTSTASTTDISNLNLKITEVVYDSEGGDEGNEYVNIFNSGDDNVDLNSFSLQYLGLDNDFSNIKKKNFESGNNILSQGYFKIGLNCHSDTPCNDVDLSWSQALNNTSGAVFLVSNQEVISDAEDNNIVNVYYYPPQNVVSFSAASSVLAGLTANFIKDSMRIDLSWQAVSSTNSSSSEVVYIIKNASSSVILGQSFSTSASVAIDEIGRTYDFLVEAVDASSSVLTSATTTVSVPSFLNSLSFYKDPRNSNDYLVEGTYNQYPFVPSLYAPTGWKVVIFYLNGEPSKQMYIENPSGDGYNWNWPAEDFSKVVGVRYTPCAYFAGESTRKGLILPDVNTNCDPLGIGVYRFAISLGSLGLNKFVVPLEKTASQITFLANDYVTAGYYSFDHANYWSGGPEVFRLVAIDKTKYYFGDAPARQTPQLSGNIDLVFNEASSTLKISWPKAVDSDSGDWQVMYEIKYSSSTDWQRVGTLTSITKPVFPGDEFLISVKATDEFNNESNALSYNWIYPVATAESTTSTSTQELSISITTSTLGIPTSTTTSSTSEISTSTAL